ncbi:carbonic anhydrase [Cryobacterium sp. CG_9.6]|uniref:carbonic anhydrase n=1 Tax=Cryobacterium sp. CG_9.6 TaxID=2760710 RepID=UPI002473E6A2|nr:carbonic anhydrase [Cryobacterium sp. CG_9.6]MDH6236072.1 carbonic anhydrase [Cryobacterium sp. CG_9.6]
MPDRLTPPAAWAEMRDGNERFVAGTPRHRQDVDRRAELTMQQTPHAALFGCSDSRLAAELIFDQGLGDLFVVRNAGQIISDSVLGSLEYAVEVLHVPLIVVLGHDKCGAVSAAIDSLTENAPLLPAHIHSIIEKIVPAVRRVSAATTGSTPTTFIDPASIDAGIVGREHLRDTVAELLERSEVISAAIAEGTLAIVGANYRLLVGTADPHIIVGVI